MNRNKPPESADIEKLIDAFRVDRESFDDIYDVTINSVYRFVASKIYDRQDAEDITSVIMFEIYRSLQSYQNEDNKFSAWWRTIASRRVNDFVKGKHAEKRVPDGLVSYFEDLTIQVAGILGVESQVDVSPLFSRTLTWIQKQKKSVQILFTKRLVDGMSFAEIAIEVDSTEQNVKSQWHYHLKKLRVEVGS